MRRCANASCSRTSINAHPSFSTSEPFDVVHVCVGSADIRANVAAWSAVVTEDAWEVRVVPDPIGTEA